MSAYTATPASETATTETPAVAQVPAPPHVECADPTGAVPWPTVLVEGGPKSGKSIEVARFTGDARFSAAFWLELGMEGTGNWYKLVPGSRYKLLTHDGKFAQIRKRIAEVHAYAQWAVDNNLPPVLFVMDTIGALWNMIQTWVDWKARQTNEAKKKLAQNPTAEIQAPINVRNQGKALWDEFLMSLNQIPGVKILISRGQEVTKFENGQPTTQKGWSVVGHKELGFDVNAWVRLQRGEPAELIAVHHPVNGIDAMAKNEREQIAREDFSLGWLVFDRYGLNPANAYVRDMHNTNDPSLVDQHASNQVDQREDQRQQQRFDDDTILEAARLLDEAQKTTSTTEFRRLWKDADRFGWAQVPIITDRTGQATPLIDLLTAEAKRIGELERQRAAGEPEAQADTTPAASPPARKLPEIEQLLLDMKIPETDWLTLATGMIGRQVKDLRHDLRGDYRATVLNELRNLVAMGADREPVLGSFILDGQKILARVASAVA